METVNWALVVLTAVLAIATIYYAYQTRETVNELRSQRQAATSTAEQVRRHGIAARKFYLIQELDQLSAMLADSGASESTFEFLPTDAWRGFLSDPEAQVDEETTQTLFGAYTLVERMNALTRVLLADRPRTVPEGGDDYGLRVVRRRELGTKFREIVDEIRPRLVAPL